MGKKSNKQLREEREETTELTVTVEELAELKKEIETKPKPETARRQTPPEKVTKVDLFIKSVRGEGTGVGAEFKKEDRQVFKVASLYSEETEAEKPTDLFVPLFTEVAKQVYEGDLVIIFCSMPGLIKFVTPLQTQVNKKTKIKPIISVGQKVSDGAKELAEDAFKTKENVVVDV